MSDLRFNNVAQALSWLEDQEPAEILEVLEEYPGVRDTLGQCPLARFCKKTTGRDVLVGLTAVAVDFDSYWLGRKLHSFRCKFDDGDYPHLESKFLEKETS